MAFLQGLTYQELAEATSEEERVVRVEHYDESKHCLQRLEPGTGAKDAPRALLPKPRRTAAGLGLRPASCVEEFEASNDLLTAKHVDDINMAGTEDTVDKHVKCVEDTF
eukprot:159984-Pyramimonas_sp.AAC.1